MRTFRSYEYQDIMYQKSRRSLQAALSYRRKPGRHCDKQIVTTNLSCHQQVTRSSAVDDKLLNAVCSL